MNTLERAKAIDEEILVRKAGSGDLEAVNELVLTYQDMAYNYAHIVLSDPTIAEDVTQESFIKAFQNLNGFRGGSFRSWLLKIVTNSAYDILRRSHRHPTQPLFPEGEDGEEIESPAWLADRSSSVQVIVEQKELSRRIDKALDELPEVFRSALTLVDVYELDYLEASRILNVPVGTIKSRVARARLFMQRKLQGYRNIPMKFDAVDTGLSAQ